MFKKCGVKKALETPFHPQKGASKPRTPMPRANRHFLTNHIWHITHRCHKREFLFKFARDRQRWLGWLFEAKKRFGLQILNYMITSNHIHLLVVGDKNQEVIPKSIQLIAGRTGQEYNQRKGRKGAFWEDRYHATAVESGIHLIQCLIYIDLNMVRAGVVVHPQEWSFSGYHEIQNPRKRYGLIEHERLIELVEAKNQEDLKHMYKEWIEERLNNGNPFREDQWTESVAVGGEEFVKEIKDGLGVKVLGRTIIMDGDQHQLRDVQQPYKPHFDPEKGRLRQNIGLDWDLYTDI
jgi:putative transposase